MTNNIRKILTVCLALTLLFIWTNSLLPGDISSQESEWVKRLLTPVMSFLQSGRIQVYLTRLACLLPPRARAFALRAVGWLDRHVLSRDPSFLVRKAAHFSEYMLLGFLLGLFLCRADLHGRFFAPELLCLPAAAVDETLQLFSAGRSAQLRDVCLDMAGATAGVIGALVFLAILRGFCRKQGDIGKNK